MAPIRALVVGTVVAGAVIAGGVLAFRSVHERYHTHHFPEDETLRDASRSVVQVIAGSSSGDDARAGVASGSGWVAKDGYVITANHVVEGAQRVLVANWDRSLEREATVVHRDAAADIAVLRVPGLDLPALELGDDTPETQTAYMLGYPASHHTFFNTDRVEIREDWGPIQIPNNDAAQTIVHGRGSIGNSGGPILDREGQVLGVVSSVDTKHDRIASVALDDVRAAMEALEL